MPNFKVDTPDNVEYVEADSMARDETILILLKDGEPVAVFQHWNYVIEQADQ